MQTSCRRMTTRCSPHQIQRGAPKNEVSKFGYGCSTGIIDKNMVTQSVSLSAIDIHVRHLWARMRFGERRWLVHGGVCAALSFLAFLRIWTIAIIVQSDCARCWTDRHPPLCFFPFGQSNNTTPICTVCERQTENEARGIKVTWFPHDATRRTRTL